MPTVFSWAYSRNNPTSPSNQVQGIWSYFEVLDHWELSFVQAKDLVSSFYVSYLGCRTPSVTMLPFLQCVFLTFFA